MSTSETLTPMEAMRYARTFTRRQLSELRWQLTHGQRLKHFANVHAGEDCFIIGNGPSLNRMDLTPLKSFHTFGLNKIYLIRDRVDLRLSYHVAVNPLVIQQSYREFQRLACPSFLSWLPARAVVPARDNIYYLRTGPSIAFSFDVASRLDEGYTVTFVALQLAFFMGFQRVVLIGVDHNFVAQGRPNEEQKLVGDDPNHFHPSYFGNQQWHLPDLEASELAYGLADFAYRRHGRQVLDATVDGKLQQFPKIPYEEALRTLRPKAGANR